MANHRLFLDEPDEGQVGKSTKYKYDDGLLEINWHGERTWFYFPRKSAVLVKCEGTMPDVVPIIVPTNFRWRTLWLCGVPKKGRCGSRAEFAAKSMENPPHRIREGEGWKVAWRLRKDGQEEIYLGWISGRINDREVSRMVEACHVTAPRWFVREVLGF